VGTLCPIIVNAPVWAARIFEEQRKRTRSGAARLRVLVQLGSPPRGLFASSEILLPADMCLVIAPATDAEKSGAVAGAPIAVLSRNVDAGRRRCFALIASVALLSLATQPGWPQSGRSMSDEDITALSLEQLGNLKVTSASLHEESLKDAPASVTIVTGEEIRKSGYRTLGEALAYVRGFFTTWDGSYTYLGARGFSLPGDYNTRTLVLINGHKMTENIFDMNLWFGQDFPLDMSMVERIEIVRGPSSALYGSNGIFATINVITRRPEDSERLMVGIETGSLGEKKIQVSGAFELPHGAHLLLSASAFNNSGEGVLYFPEFDSPQTNNGRAVNMEGEKGFHLFGDFSWKNWEVLFVQGDRVQIQPISWGATIFNDRGTRAEESLGFVDVSYTRHLTGDKVLRWRTYYDAYRYRGIYRRDLEGEVEDNRERDYGDWLGSEVTYRFPFLGPGSLTVGAEGKVDLRTMQNVYDIQPVKLERLNVNQRDKYAGLFAQQEWAFGSRWKLDAGGRFDASGYRQNFVSPRTAVIYQPSQKTTYKFLFGRAFRNPSAYEMFFDDGGLSAVANPSLKPETANTYEVVYERGWNRDWKTNLSVYRYDLSDVISGTYTPEGLWQYVNTSEVRASGIEAEVSGRLFSTVDLLASLAIQRATALDRAVLTNSPGTLGKLRISLPVIKRRFALSGGLIYMSERRTNAQAQVPAVFLPDLTFSSSKLIHNFSFSCGIRNLFNAGYNDPIALVGSADTIPRSGRTAFLTVQWHSND
jgi:outer membrane receptor for ferrienterochelin and colicins